MLRIGTMIGKRYEILELVGSGGMSEVYKAKCHKLNRFVAIKVLKDEFCDDKSFVTKFRVEAQSAAGLSHPNIVSVYDVGEEDEIHYIVMELVEGITLKKYIMQKGRIDVKQAIDFSIQIATGLEIAHNNHTIHRDIKPQNIIVSKSGIIKITDFGIARAVTSNTVTANAVGSVHYISPEQARGGYSDERSDIYSLGITMYEMITGKVPFDGENNVSIALMHLQGEMAPPRQICPDIPAGLEKIILKCTQKKPERRYLTAKSLIEDLKKVKDNPIGEFIDLNSNVDDSPTVFMPNLKKYQINDNSEENLNNNIKNNIKNSNNINTTEEKSIKDKNATNDNNVDNKQDNINNKLNNNISDNVNNNKVNSQKFDKNEDVNNKEQDEDELDEDINPKLEKVVVVLGIVAGVIVAMLFIFLIGKAIGVWNTSNNNRNNNATTESMLNNNRNENKNTTATEYDELTEDTDTEDTDVTEDTDTEDTDITENISTTASYTTTAQVKQTTIVPDVRGYKEATAKSTLEARNIVCKISYVYSNSISEGLVISQSIDPTLEIDKYSTVEIVVSKGKEPYVIPNVVGMEYESAVNEIEANGFKANPSFEYSDEIEKGLVIRQDPTGHSQGVSQSIVNIYVSNGKEIKEVEVKSLYNMTLEEAESVLESLGLKLGSVTEENSDDYSVGMVMGQSYKEGTKLPQGTTVDITISKGAKYVEKTYGATVTISSDYSPFSEDIVSGDLEIVFEQNGTENSVYYKSSATEDIFPINLNITGDSGLGVLIIYLDGQQQPGTISVDLVEQ